MTVKPTVAVIGSLLVAGIRAPAAAQQWAAARCVPSAERHPVHSVFWVPVFNDGVKAWQAGNTDSAIASFRRANAIYGGEPSGFNYLGTLFANANQPDSSAKYFKLAVPAASDPKFTKEKRDALFNVARVYHAAQR